TKEVRARNFEYDPATVGSDTHDASIIAEYEVKDAKGARRTLVDFDDASTELIRVWANSRPPRRAHALLMAHHGSAYNDMSTILADPDKYGLTDIIFTANEGNRFRHPTPKSLRLAIETVGPDHVHITGSANGDAIEIGAVGELVRSRPGDVRARLEEF